MELDLDLLSSVDLIGIITLSFIVNGIVMLAWLVAPLMYVIYPRCSHDVPEIKVNVMV